MFFRILSGYYRLITQDQPYNALRFFRLPTSDFGTLLYSVVAFVAPGILLIASRKASTEAVIMSVLAPNP